MTTSTWLVAGASVAGTRHIENSLPCQDAHAYRLLPSGELLVAVADGAGSAERAEQGSDCAAQQALDSLELALSEQRPASADAWRGLMCQAFDAVAQALAQLAEQQGAPVRSFATTLTCAVVMDDRLIVGQIGDGAAVARDEAGALSIAIQPQRGEYANEVYLLTTPRALDNLEVRVIERSIQSVAVITDGLLRLALKLPQYEPHNPFFLPLWEFVAESATNPATEPADGVEQQLAAFLASERVCARTDDDKTLVLAVRSARAGSQLESREAEQVALPAEQNETPLPS